MHKSSYYCITIRVLVQCYKGLKELLQIAELKEEEHAYGLSFGIKYSKIKATKQHIPIVNRYPSSSLIPI